MTRQVDPYLSFDGNCKDAFEFYVKALGAKLDTVWTYGKSPMGAQFPAEAADKVMHAKLLIDDQVVMGSDYPPGVPVQAMGGFSLSVNFPTTAAAKQAFAALADGGKVTMPIDKTFWAAAFGMLVDRFGVPWMIGCEKE